MFGRGKMFATLVAVTATLIAAASANAARPATEAETNQIYASAVKLYGAALPGNCRSAATAVVSTADPGWARLDVAERPLDFEDLSVEACTAETVLAVRLPGYRSYSMAWGDDTDRQPCWAMGTAVWRDLIPDAKCQAGRQRTLTVMRGDPVPGPRVGLRSPTAAEAGAIARAQYGSRKRCYSSLDIKVARGNKGWARIQGRSDWRRYPVSCLGNGVALYVQLPGSRRWMQAWGTSEGWIAPCWLAGGNTARALVGSWAWRCETPERSVELRPLH